MNFKKPNYSNLSKKEFIEYIEGEKFLKMFVDMCVGGPFDKDIKTIISSIDGQNNSNYIEKNVDSVLSYLVELNI